jgi:hypothetical protein
MIKYNNDNNLMIIKNKLVLNWWYLKSEWEYKSEVKHVWMWNNQNKNNKWLWL